MCCEKCRVCQFTNSCSNCLHTWRRSTSTHAAASCLGTHVDVVSAFFASFLPLVVFSLSFFFSYTHTHTHTHTHTLVIVSAFDFFLYLSRSVQYLFRFSSLCRSSTCFAASISSSRRDSDTLHPARSSNSSSIQKLCQAQQSNSGGHQRIKQEAPGFTKLSTKRHRTF